MIKEYKGYYIEFNFYGHKEYSVQYCGHDVCFESEEAAKAFIDEVAGKTNTVLYRLTTTFLGADRPQAFYFDTKSAAELNLMHLDNGAVEKVLVKSDYELNYSDGCTLNDLTWGYFDVDISVCD